MRTQTILVKVVYCGQCSVVARSQKTNRPVTLNLEWSEVSGSSWRPARVWAHKCSTGPNRAWHMATHAAVLRVTETAGSVQVTFFPTWHFPKPTQLLHGWQNLETSVKSECGDATSVVWYVPVHGGARTGSAMMATAQESDWPPELDVGESECMLHHSRVHVIPARIASGPRCLRRPVVA